MPDPLPPDPRPRIVPEMLARCETDEERETMWERIVSSLQDLRDFEAEQRARGNPANTLAVIMARLQRRAGVRPSKPRLVVINDD